MTEIVDQLRKRDFIADQISRYAGEKKHSTNRVVIQCPFHADKTPSGAIWMGNDRFVGNFKCWGCGKHASWDDLAPRIGLLPFRRGKPQEEETIDLGLERMMAALQRTARYRDDEFRFSELPKNKFWRGIPTNLLINIGGKLSQRYNEGGYWENEQFIYFPVKINEEQHGFFRARLKKHPDLPSYILAAADGSRWSSTHGLWPHGTAIKLMDQLDSRAIVLVEGQRDALRLINNGIPAMCIFGTQSWTPEKARLLEMSGVEHVILMMDGDCAGKAATTKIVPTLDGIVDMVTPLKLWNVEGSPYKLFAHLPEPSKAAKQAGYELWDPGNVPQSIIDRVKRNFF